MPEMTAAPFPLKLGDLDLKLEPLTDKDIEELDNWLRSTMIDMARKSLTPDMTQQERDEILGAAMREARHMQMLSQQGARFVSSVEGITRVIYQSLTDDSRTLVSYEALRDALMKPENVDAAMLVWKELNVHKQNGASKKTKSKTKSKKPRSRKKRSTRP